MATENALARAGFEGPVLKAEDDRYGYTAIAEGLARSISALDENVSTVIGIEGQWGSGKTSLLNLLTDKLKAQVPATTQIVVFSPWVNSPDESPVNALMMTIAARLAKLDTSAMAQAGKVAPLAEDILNYAQQTSRRLAPVTRFAGNFIPGLGLVADGMDALANTGLSGREKTAAELRADIEDKIAGLGVSFIVVIDDLDRLEPAQAVEVLRMVRSVADFSRFRYVMCYDRDVLAHAVETGLGVQNGKRYLQKIIPLSFSLPRPENFALRREFHRGAMTIWQEVSGPVTDNESSELLSHYVDVYGEGLSTPREVNQVLNSIRFRYPGLRDYVFYPDLCLLQLISVVNPLFAGWVEHYLTVWSVVENRDGIAHEDEQKALIAELAEALKKFGASRAASVWELRAWMPGISGFEYDHLRLFETIPLQDTERYRQKRRLCSGEYWRYYFSYSSPQNVMSDEDISSIMKLAACNYAGLKKRLLDSVTSNGVSSRTWFEHILTRLSPSVTVGAETSAKRNLVKFFFSCSDQVLPWYRARDILFRQEKIGIDGLVSQLALQMITRDRRRAISFICRCFRQTRAFVWATVFLRNIRANSAQGDAVFTQDEITIFCTALSERLQEKHIQEKMPDVPYLATFLYAWRDIAGEQTVAQWISGVDQSDRDFLKMLLNLRTAVSSSNQGDYLRLDLDVIGTVFGITGLMERFEDIKARQEASLTGMISGIEDAILLNKNTI
ncbi:P-loop NTPase fold protein [Klebsiella pneumoniae]|uniref:KAP family P-loop NTPase fold protein n=1 Tax=Klebsiella pneumoniae TaxID=573 RepID=UPI0025AACCE3|nr:P-loop NTPase fold protein [Klebsiella pneumoniae]MDN0134295.1 P-loop NTPase fold protein [Klebsiella pneumoniae]